MAKNDKNTSNKVYDLYCQIEKQNELLKWYAVNIGFNGTDSDKKNFRKILWLLEEKYKANLKLITEIIEVIDNEKL